MQKRDICEAEVVFKTSEGIAALGYEGNILEGAVASLPAFIGKGNGKMFPGCKHDRGMFICLLES